MEQMITEQVITQSRNVNVGGAVYAQTSWPAMQHLLTVMNGAKEHLADSESCLEILAADISDERVNGARPFAYAGSSVEHWEDHYLRLVAEGFEKLMAKGKGAGPVQMYMLRRSALKMLLPFKEVRAFEETGEAGIRETSPAAMLAYQQGKTFVFEGYENDMLPSERKYNGV